MQKFTLLTAFILFAASFSFAQDKIYRKNGKIVEAKIIEIGSAEIKYKEFKDLDGPVYVLETDRIEKIVFESGKVQRFTIDIKDPERYTDQLSKAIKLDFLGPLLGYCQFTFEKSTAIGKSYELSLGIIGAGNNWRIDYYDNQFHNARRDQFGVFIAGGYKFGKLPDFFLFGKTRMSHRMQGTYIRPTVYLGDYSENRITYKASSQYVVERKNIVFGAIQIEGGKQWVFGDKVLLDLYWGLGYGFDNKKMDYYDPYYYGEDDYSAYNYANARIGRSPGLSTTFGVKLGMLLK